MVDKIIEYYYSHIRTCFNIMGTSFEHIPRPIQGPRKELKFSKSEKMNKNNDFFAKKNLEGILHLDFFIQSNFNFMSEYSDNVAYEQFHDVCFWNY